LQTSQDEIDFEFLNGANGIPTWLQGSIWTNIFVNGQSQKHVRGKSSFCLPLAPLPAPPAPAASSADGV
jgi:hypothetical protein